jgi:hypothetical protein
MKPAIFGDSWKFALECYYPQALKRLVTAYLKEDYLPGLHRTLTVDVGNRIARPDARDRNNRELKRKNQKYGSHDLPYLSNFAFIQQVGEVKHEKKPEIGRDRGLLDDGDSSTRSGCSPRALGTD